MMDRTDIDNLLRWWNKIPSCFHAPDRGCVSHALGLLSILSTVIFYCILLCSRYALGDAHSPSAAALALYCLIGNMCNVAGAFLSHQLPIQMIIASLTAALDVVHFISLTLRVCLWRHSKTGRRARMMNRRKGQNSLAVCLLFAMGGCVYLREGIHHSHLPSIRSPTSRKLLNVFLHDRIEPLGYVLGLLFFAISWTSRFPFLLQAKRGDVSNPMHVSSRVLSALAAAFYASSILLYDTQLKAVVKALPWILSGVGCAVLEVAIMGLTCHRMRHKRESGQLLDSDTEQLLGRCLRPSSGQHSNTRDRAVRKQLIPLRKSNSPKMNEMGHYMDVNVQPVRKVCLKEVTVTQDGSAESQSLKRSVKVVRVDECYSSGSITDSSSSSELEWDFEETASQWRSQNAHLPNVEAFPLQEWMVDQRPRSDKGSDFYACSDNRTDHAERTAFASPGTNLNLSDSVK